jgi:hypothetical protein
VLACVAAVLLQTVLVAAHSHTVGYIEVLPGCANGVPLSVINNPDAPSDHQHWHAGRVIDEEPCAACILSHQIGRIAPSAAIHPAVVALSLTVPLAATAFSVSSEAPTARAPPSSC